MIHISAFQGAPAAALPQCAISLFETSVVHEKLCLADFYRGAWYEFQGEDSLEGSTGMFVALYRRCL